VKTGLSQHQGLRQELRINPRLYQAMDMLYMPMMDLQQHLKQELLVNPFLELLEPEEEEQDGADREKDKEQEKEQAAKEEEMDWEEILLNGFDVGGTREQHEQLEYTEPVTVQTRDLVDHLREQLKMLDLTPRQVLLSEEFLGNIKDDGFLAASLEEIVGSVNQLLVSHSKGETDPDEEEADDGSDHAAGDLPAGVTLYGLEEAEEMLRIIQALDPPGVAARDIQECLLIQLRELGQTETLTYRLVAEAFGDLIAHRWNDLARRFGVSASAVQSAADALASLDPKPGLKYSGRDSGCRGRTRKSPATARSSRPRTGSSSRPR
jgi:RNA polymerase sigma-54 factor